MTYIERTVNVETGEIIEIPYSDDQIAELENKKAALEIALAEEEAKKAAKIALLDKLGITEEEAKLLLS